jgi:hypothetical protein
LSIALHEKAWPSVPQEKKAAGEPTPAASNLLTSNRIEAPHRGDDMRVERLIIALCALIGAAGLFLFARHVWNAGAPQTDPSGITIRSEILTIYAPKSLIDFAKAHPEMTTNDDLVRVIREAKLNVWFAIVDRHHQANGNFADVAISYRPGESPECFDSTKAVLLTLAGNPPELGTVSYRNAKTEVIEDAMMELEPVDGLRQC